MREGQRLYVASTYALGGTRRVTGEFFTNQNGFDENARRHIEKLPVDDTLVFEGRENASSVRRIK